MDFLISAVGQATLVSKGVLVILLLMSLVSWAYMGGKWFALASARKRADDGIDGMDRADTLTRALQGLGGDERSPLFGITRRAVREFNRINATGDADRLLNDNVRRALHFGIAEEMHRLRSSLSMLATTSNTAPFIGLFGTVWGIMHSFHAIGEMKSVSLATVAPGIAEALIATAMGLFVAIPATCGYNIFSARLAALEGLFVNFGGQLLNRMQHEAETHPEGLIFAGAR